MYLETERLIIRDFKMTDVDAYYNMVKNKELTYRAGFKNHADRETTEYMVNSILYNRDYVAVTLKDDTFIGDINFYKDPLRPRFDAWQLGFILNKPYWHKGYMKEALKAFITYFYKHKRIDILSCVTMIDNYDSQHLIESLGFNYDGVIKCYKKMYDGNIIDCKLYTLKNVEIERMIKQWQKN